MAGMWPLIAAATGLAIITYARKSAAQPMQSSAQFSLSQQGIIEAVRSGRAQFTWAPLPGAPGVSVTTDAIRVDGVLVPVSAATTAAIAEILSGALGKNVVPTTALVEDLIWAGAGVHVEPPLYDPSRPGAADIQVRDTTIREYSALLDRQIERSRSLGASGPIVACVGKSWILSNLAIEHPGRAINYGMYRSDGLYSSVTGGYKLWQQPSWAHSPDHWDYSQTCRLALLEAGASLPNHDGQLRATKLWY